MKYAFKTIAFGAFAAFAVDAAPALADTGDCSAPGVLSTIDRRFDTRAVRYLHSDLDILAFSNVHRSRTVPRNDTRNVERVYCKASASMNDGRTRDVWYMIESNGGFAGLGDSVRFCLSGLDPWYVYGRHCRSLR
jgi:hypothetical protein